MANVMAQESRKRAYAEISEGCNRDPDCISPVRKKMVLYGGRRLGKRPYCETSQGGNRHPDCISPVRKKMVLYGGRRLGKRAYCETSQGGSRHPDTTSPERKKRNNYKRVPLLQRLYGKDSKESKRIPEISSSEGQRRITIDTEDKHTDPKRTSKEPSSTLKSPKKKEDESLTQIWIIGSSYIRRGEQAAFENFGENLGLNAKVKWFGKGGMRWSGVLPRFYAELENSQSPPNILVVHAGGNDLGSLPAKTLASTMKKDLMQLRADFPSMKIVYSSINERQVWRYGQQGDMNIDRNAVNKCMTEVVGNFGGDVILHPLLRHSDSTVFHTDGVHFSKKGNGIFLTSIRRVLKNGSAIPPRTQT